MGRINKFIKIGTRKYRFHKTIKNEKKEEIENKEIYKDNSFFFKKTINRSWHWYVAITTDN